MQSAEYLYHDLPCSVCDVDSARAPQLDWTSGPRMVTSELPRFISAAFRGATWLNWTAERQPTKPCDAACDTFSLKFSLPGGEDSEASALRFPTVSRKTRRNQTTGSRFDTQWVIFLRLTSPFASTTVTSSSSINLFEGPPLVLQCESNWRCIHCPSVWPLWLYLNIE